MSLKPSMIAEVEHFIGQGNTQKARERLQPKLKSAQNNAWAQFAMGTICLLENNLQDAEYYLKKATEIDPKFIPAYSNLGVVYAKGRASPELIVGTFNKILEINPSHYGTLLNLGKYYIQIAEASGAHEAFGKMAKLKPDNTANRGHYLSCIFSLKYHDELIKNINELISNGYNIEPFDVGIFPLFAAMRQYCMWEDSKRILPGILKKLETEWFKLQLPPYMEVNMMALAMPEFSYSKLLTLHKLAGAVAKKDMRGAVYSTYPNAMKPAKRWKIGIFSPDYRKHVVDLYLRGIIKECNRQYFEIVCYSNTKCKDNITDIYSSLADKFVDVTTLTDRELADRIYADGIHILLHATVYAVGSRTEFIFYKPAPVQIMYMGYPFTSGIDAVDYFISDPYLDGPENAQYFVEQQIHLPECFVGIDDTQDQNIADHAPCISNGYITFGSLIQPYKISDHVVALWARVLNAVPGSKMILNNPGYCVRAPIENITNEFAKYDIEDDRLIFIWDSHPQGSHLRYYNDIDVSLDVFPMTGGASTMDALWMGVPVVTLVGAVYHERISYSMIKNVGLPLEDCIAFSQDEYIQKAVGLAQNTARINDLRHAIPEQLKSSILRDPLLLTRHLERVFLEAWDRKFPTRPVNMENRLARTHTLASGEVFVTADNLDDEFNYVFQEQGQWYESEWRFLQQIAQSGDRVLDIGAAVGHYALPLAQRVGRKGKVWVTTQYPHEAEWIKASLKHYSDCNVDIIQKGDRKLRLDHECTQHSISGIDILRISTHSAENRLFKYGAQFFSEQSPLIMFGITKVGDSFDFSFANQLRERGYQLFRLLPGLNTLVPLAEYSELDVFAHNLFACKSERAQKLSEAGYLVESIANQIQIPDAACVDWQIYLREQAYASDHVATWSLASTPKPAGWETYWAALNLYARAQVSSQLPSFKVACMQGALNLLLQLAQQEMRFSRVVTLIRVLRDLGKREEAVHLLTHVCGAIDSSGEIIMDEPFIAASDEVQACGTLAQLGRSVFADLLHQREKLRMFSTYFTGTESLRVLQAIEAAGFGNDELRRRAELMMSKANLNQ